MIYKLDGFMHEYTGPVRAILELRFEFFKLTLLFYGLIESNDSHVFFALLKNLSFNASTLCTQSCQSVMCKYMQTANHWTGERRPFFTVSLRIPLPPWRDANARKRRRKILLDIPSSNKKVA